MCVCVCVCVCVVCVFECSVCVQISSLKPLGN